MPERTYLELSEDAGVSHKFYEVIVDGATMNIRYGRIGDAGRSSSKTFASPEAATKEANKKIKSKKKKGYEEAVMGVRKKRPITRRTISETRSTAKGAPTVWQFKSGSSAFGIFVDEDWAWVGNEAGELYKLSHDGKVDRKYKLPDGVKCIVADGQWLYAGCDDGNVYDLTGKAPYIAYEIDESVDIYWLDISDGILGISDSKGGIMAVNHEDENQWSHSSSGSSGWMVRCDEHGLYHGHSGGVTHYDWDGDSIWTRKTKGSVLFGWQDEDEVFAGTSGRAVQRINKSTGEVVNTYPCDAAIYSCATSDDGLYVFAGDSSSSIYCFGPDNKRIWKFNTGCGSAFSMQYFNEKLYIVTTKGVLSAIDVSLEAIKAAEAGTTPKVKNVKASAAVVSDTRQAEAALETTSSAGDGVVVECYKKGSKLKIRVVSDGYKKDLNVQFPKKIRKEGMRYVVREVREASNGSFYRAMGPIKVLES